MAVNAGYTRRQELSCTLEEAEMYAAVVLYADEVIYIKQKDGNYAVKMGDGVTPLGELEYVINYSEISAQAAAAQNAKSLAEKAQRAAETAKAGAEAAVASLDIGLTVVDGKLNITFEEDI